MWWKKIVATTNFILVCAVIMASNPILMYFLFDNVVCPGCIKVFRLDVVFANLDSIQNPIKVLNTEKNFYAPVAKMTNQGKRIKI
ncbi:hypothetical protein [Parasediminibacterium sp. JCM 36343]|uniref:hypothetical protein n=1 Tax=Parasediminibacterium sp. JCM 36343 TaxID=3374279 RepID=UPI00397CFF8E